MQNKTYFIVPPSHRIASLVLILWFTFPSSIFAQERVFFGNLHSHTSFSDRTGTPKEVYRHARNVAKLDFLALTENNHSKTLGKDRIGIARNHALYNGGPNSLKLRQNRLRSVGVL